jgi:hypothetical protein
VCVGNKEPRTFLPCAPLGFERRVHCMPVHDPQLWHSTLNTLVKRGRGGLFWYRCYLTEGQNGLFCHLWPQPILPILPAFSAGVLILGQSEPAAPTPAYHELTMVPLHKFFENRDYVKMNQSFDFLEPVDKWVYVQDDNQWVSFPHSKNRPTLITTALTSV